MLRQDLENREEAMLSPVATLSKHSRGRLHPVTPCELRTDFQRDRDRIIHSKGFRRLKHKTQAFLPSHGDHFRTRLTHTLEVSQVARTVARGLYLNEDLAEAIALGHDLGHTPFGHSGERALREFLPDFQHNVQSLRLVDLLENEGHGLNLTFEVRDGILRHTGDALPQTPEGQIVRFADRIAYVNHDIDDAMRSGVLHTDELPPQALRVLGFSHGERINTLVKALIEHNRDAAHITMPQEVAAALDELRDFLFANVYRRPAVAEEEERAHRIIAGLFRHYREQLSELPAYLNDPDPDIRIKDYIAGMTDPFAIETWNNLHIQTP